MSRYQIVLEYDGTDFCGYQIQKSGRSVQGELETALCRLNKGNPVTSHVAGRTDTGVHALGQVVAFDLEWRHGLDGLQRALNAHLPADMAVRAASEAAPNFLPRFAARGRIYRYHIHQSPARSPLMHRTAWRVWPPINIAAMQQAAPLFCGTHDFATVGTAPVTGGHTVRTIERAEWTEREDLLWFEIEGNAFLYHMVRNIVAMMYSVGSGRWTVAEVAEKLAARNRDACPPPAPPQGLVLLQVLF